MEKASTRMMMSNMVGGVGMMEADSFSAPAPVEMGGGDLTLWRIPTAVSVRPGAVQRLPLLPEDTKTVALRKHLTWTVAGNSRVGSTPAPEKPAASYRFTSPSVALPAGLVHVYATPTADDALTAGSEPILLGVDSLGNISPGSPVSVAVGRAGDVSCYQTVLSSTRNGKSQTEEVELRCRAGDHFDPENITLEVHARLPYGELKSFSATGPQPRVEEPYRSAATAHWSVAALDAGPGDVFSVFYRVTVRDWTYD
eukprot:gnl/Ergobibamus_cyprinoides/858.p1 GENE.gnl/Ergobibamus_cyprinoides/858~~gnl/Ergobibamus_cyprinoides/858.p1  ORF type:complete len:255 (+),score=50.69 gnl/Ergobibamus_cyprinoides/858:159-923(+)